MEVSSLYTNIPPPPIPKRLLEKAPKLTLKENPSQLNGQSYLQTHGRGIGTKTAVALANIFMAKIEMQVLDKGARLEALIDNIISLMHTNRFVVKHFIEQANNRHPTIKFTGEISVSKATFLDTTIYKGQRFNKVSFSTWELISNQQRHSCTNSTRCVTHQEHWTASLKAKCYDSPRLIL